MGFNTRTFLVRHVSCSWTLSQSRGLKRVSSIFSLSLPFSLLAQARKLASTYARILSPDQRRALKLKRCKSLLRSCRSSLLLSLSLSIFSSHCFSSLLLYSATKVEENRPKTKQTNQRRRDLKTTRVDESCASSLYSSAFSVHSFTAALIVQFTFDSSTYLLDHLLLVFVRLATNCLLCFIFNLSLYLISSVSRASQGFATCYNRVPWTPSRRTCADWAPVWRNHKMASPRRTDRSRPHFRTSWCPRSTGQPISTLNCWPQSVAICVILLVSLTVATGGEGRCKWSAPRTSRWWSWWSSSPCNRRRCPWYVAFFGLSSQCMIRWYAIEYLCHFYLHSKENLFCQLF